MKAVLALLRDLINLILKMMSSKEEPATQEPQRPVKAEPTEPSTPVPDERLERLSDVTAALSQAPSASEEIRDADKVAKSEIRKPRHRRSPKKVDQAEETVRKTARPQRLSRREAEDKADAAMLKRKSKKK